MIRLMKERKIGKITSLKKSIKERDRDLQKINGKYEKLETTTKRLKCEIASLKTDDKKRVKYEALQHRKKTSNQPILSLIESESSLTVSTENNASENTSFTPKSPLNNSNRQIITSPQCSSPHTPPGPPPTTAALDHTSPSVSQTPEALQHKAEADVKKTNLEGIKKVGRLEELLETIKNAKLVSDDDEDDDYGNVDVDSYPDYYWKMGYETDDGKHYDLSE